MKNKKKNKTLIYTKSVLGAILMLLGVWNRTHNHWIC